MTNSDFVSFLSINCLYFCLIVIRNVGMGVSSMCARIGGILAPQIILLGSVFRSMPFIVFGVLSVLTGLLDLLLPETMGKPLPQTIEEMTMQKR